MHSLVRETLERDGWEVTDDPYSIRYGNKKIEIDLAAEQLLAAERGPEKIVVEVKSFLSKAVFNEFHEALGQFINYRRVLKFNQDSHKLYLAIPSDAYQFIFEDDLGRATLEEERLSLIVFSVKEKAILEWIN